MSTFIFIIVIIIIIINVSDFNQKSKTKIEKNCPPEKDAEDISLYTSPARMK